MVESKPVKCKVVSEYRGASEEREIPFGFLEELGESPRKIFEN